MVTTIGNASMCWGINMRTCMDMLTTAGVMQMLWVALFLFNSYGISEGSQGSGACGNATAEGLLPSCKGMSMLVCLMRWFKECNDAIMVNNLFYCWLVQRDTLFIVIAYVVCAYSSDLGGNSTANVALHFFLKLILVRLWTKAHK